MKYGTRDYWERQAKAEGERWKFEKKEEEVKITIDKTVIFEWYRRYGQTQHCPSCNARHAGGWGVGHAPACEYIKWLTTTYPQYSIKSGKKVKPVRRTPRKQPRSEVTTRKKEEQ